MVSIEQTSRKYHGRKAETYEQVRTKQRRWHAENEAVARMLAAIKPASVLDCPVGTGRFLKFYEKIDVPFVIGLDASSEMLGLARRKFKRKPPWLELDKGDATDIGHISMDAAVCVRFLDLIDEDAMRKVMTELCRVARRGIILTIRLGDSYTPKSNTATHDRKKFWALVRRLEWEQAEVVPWRDAGWQIIWLKRR